MGCASSSPVAAAGGVVPGDVDGDPTAGGGASSSSSSSSFGQPSTAVALAPAEVRTYLRGSASSNALLRGVPSFRSGASSGGLLSSPSRRGAAGAEGVGGGPGAMVVPPPPPSTSRYSFKRIQDKYGSVEEVSEGLRRAGLESSNLIVAVDYTKSNTWTGKDTFGGRSLHWLDPTGKDMNPYMLAISCIGRALTHLDDDNLIPVFGFGDSTTADRSVFPFFPDRPARGFEEVLARYRELTPRVVLGGPTNFAPAIEAAIQIVQATRAYHILLIIADGQVTNRAHTEAAIVRASEFPLSIILVGVGDGPWDQMDAFDDELPQRRFDNFQFVCLSKIQQAFPANPEVAFALAAMMELPDQFLAIRELGYI